MGGVDRGHLPPAAVQRLLEYAPDGRPTYEVALSDWAVAHVTTLLMEACGLEVVDHILAATFDPVCDQAAPAPCVGCTKGPLSLHSPTW